MLPRGVELRMVADKGHTPDEPWDDVALVTRRDLIDAGRVKDYSDLPGLKLAMSGRGNSPEVALATALKRGGHTLEDIELTSMGFPEMGSALQSRVIDVGIVIEPFLSQVVHNGTGVTWKGNVEIFDGDQHIAAIIYREQFARNREVAQRWMPAYIRGVRDYNDAFGPGKKTFDAVVPVPTDNTSVKNPQFTRR
jgi:NitT/TauT family transport system substrate-binding protein